MPVCMCFDESLRKKKSNQPKSLLQCTASQSALCAWLLRVSQRATTKNQEKQSSVKKGASVHELFDLTLRILQAPLSLILASLTRQVVCDRERRIVSLTTIVVLTTRDVVKPRMHLQVDRPKSEAMTEEGIGLCRTMSRKARRG
jgi:hypothetical protein